MQDLQARPGDGQGLSKERAETGAEHPAQDAAMEAEQLIPLGLRHHQVQGTFSIGVNWGSNEMTNAAFIQGAARDYFRRFLEGTVALIMLRRGGY